MKRDNWGAKKWYEIHTKAIDYPKNPNENEKEEMKKYILEIHKTITCGTCRKDTFNYILKFESQMNDICSSRDKVFNFFVDFHNVINEKLNKPKFNYYQAYNIYMLDKIYRKLNYKI